MSAIVELYLRFLLHLHGVVLYLFLQLCLILQIIALHISVIILFLLRVNTFSFPSPAGYCVHISVCGGGGRGLRGSRCLAVLIVLQGEWHSKAQVKVEILVFIANGQHKEKRLV
jgi:hypothetical protein